MLPRLTPKQRQRANALIKRLCANYDNGNCLALDDGEPCACVQSISYSLLCKYFRSAVLPADLADCLIVFSVCSTALMVLFPEVRTVCLFIDSAARFSRNL